MSLPTHLSSSPTCFFVVLPSLPSHPPPPPHPQYFAISCLINGLVEIWVPVLGRSNSTLPLSSPNDGPRAPLMGDSKGSRGAAAAPASDGPTSPLKGALADILPYTLHVRDVGRACVVGYLPGMF